MEKNIEYKVAEFYKCTLQVNPFDYFKQYQKIEYGFGEEEYNQKILEKCNKTEIEAVGLADIKTIHGN